MSWHCHAAALGTKHDKLAQIAPALKGAGYLVEEVAIDTDAFGTFTGERARQGSPHEVVLAKARAAADTSGLSVGMGSEGTFCPHPLAPGLTLDVELVGLVDDAGLSVVGEASDVVAPVRAIVASDAPPADFLQAIGFPDQRLVVRVHDASPSVVAKGVGTLDELERAIATARRQAAGREAVLELDFRAMHCPSRRAVIAAAAEELARLLRTSCPACERPGFGLVTVELGLPCAGCGWPTPEAWATMTTCSACGGHERELHDGAADPSRCPRCNP